MAHPYSSVILFPFIDLVGVGGIFFGLLRNKLDMHFFLEILKGGGIKSPHINKMFFISSDTKHKLDRWYKSFPASKLVWLDIYFHLLWKWVSVCLHGWPLDTFPVILRSLPFLEQTGKLNLPGIIIMRVPSASNPWFPTSGITVNLFSPTLFCFWSLRLWTWDKGVSMHSAFLSLCLLS